MTAHKKKPDPDQPEQMADVIPFPPVRTCFACVHYVESYCRLFDEAIDSELYAARDCVGFEPE